MQTKCIVADFSSGKEIYERIKHEIGSIPVGILGEYVALLNIFRIFFDIFSPKPLEFFQKKVTFMIEFL